MISVRSLAKEELVDLKCDCSMSQSVLGDGCSICNPKYWEEHLELARFDDWFDSQGFDEQYREMFEKVWMAVLRLRRDL